MTDLAYLADMPSAYVRSFRARVTALPPGGVVLDRTYFYPSGGGQPSDRGTLRPVTGTPLEVTDVTKSGPGVLHRLARAGRPPALPVGAEVEGQIDWARRYQHMRLHTAQHLLSARAFARFGLRTRRASMAGAGGTIDLESAWPALERVGALEDDLNDLFARSLEVRIALVPRAQWEGAAAGRSGLVPLAPHVDPVRVIEIDGVDRCPCGGTHVRSTAEVGRVRLSDPVPIPEGASRIPFTLTGDGAIPSA
ncbi:MAG: alanyl-tRNA editing protein [Thermoplasmata archaeon]